VFFDHTAAYDTVCSGGLSNLGAPVTEVSYDFYKIIVQFL